MSTSPNFTKYCSEFIDKAVPVVLEAQKKVHLTQKRKATYNPDGSTSTVNVPDYLRFTFHIQEDIKHLSEFEYLLEFLQENSKFSGTKANFERIVLLILGRFLEIISAQNRLRLALNRYNNSFERTNIADRVIDLAIVFEILFSKENDKTDSINFKLKSRTAKFLGSDFENRRSIARTIGKFYSIRSGLVHGGKANLDKTDMEVVQTANNLLRESLILYIEKIFSSKSSSEFDHDSLIEFIDYN